MALNFKKIYLEWRLFKATFIIVVIYSVIVTFIPLVNTIGYEFALVSAPFFSLFSGLISISYLQRIRDQLAPFPGALSPIFRLFIKLVIIVTSVFLFPLASLLILGAFKGYCNIKIGLIFFLLLALSSAYMGIIYSLLVGFLFPYYLGLVTWILAWLSSFIIPFLLFLKTPSVEFVGTFFGFFSGPIYDEYIGIPKKLVAFRILNLFEAVALLIIFSKSIKVDSLRFSLKAIYSNKRVVFLSSIFYLLLQLVYFFMSKITGWFYTSNDIQHILGGKWSFRDVTVYYPEDLEPKDTKWMKYDVLYDLDRVKDFLNVKRDTKIKLYFFASPEEKERLMGAYHTHIAKPWRKEAYLNIEPFPHPTLTHEITHIITGEISNNFLKIPGKVGGLFGIGGLIEGVAVATDWENDDYFSPDEWSAALLKIGKLPQIESLMGLRFLGESSLLGYTISGSFIRFLIYKYGIEAFHQLYRTYDFKTTYHKSLKELENEWKDYLRKKIKLNERLIGLATIRFAVPSIFFKKCPHEVARLIKEISIMWSENKRTKILTLLTQLVKIDSSFRSKLIYTKTLLKTGNLKSALINYSKLKDFINSIEDKIGYYHLGGDLYWLKRDYNKAAQFYKTVLQFPLDYDTERLIQVKYFSVQNPNDGELLKDYLLSDYLNSPFSLQLIKLKDFIERQPNIGIGYYLLGRRLFNDREYEEAVHYLEKALKYNLISSIIKIEAKKLLAISYLFLEQFDKAIELFKTIRKEGYEEMPDGWLFSIDQWIRRTEWIRKHKSDILGQEY